MIPTFAPLLALDLTVFSCLVRGGGEFGPAWHQAALKDKRNKCYEDFIAVAEHLESSGICTPKTLAARGGSNVSSQCHR